MRGFVAPTDHGWWRFLSRRPDLQEVNFWRPGAVTFAALVDVPRDVLNRVG